MEIKTGKLTAIWSFGIGTFLFLAYLTTNNSIFLPLGLYYLITIIPFNLIILLLVTIAMLMKKEDKIAHIKTIGLILLNIPIAWLYFNLLTF